MFTKYELETISIMVLSIHNNKWFTKQCLFDEVSKYYINNIDELYYGHFLFVWTKLLNNKNFISVHSSGDKIKNKTNENESFKDFNEDQIDVIHDMNLQVQIKHMLEYPKLYQESRLIKEYLLNNYDCDLFFKLFNLYQKILSLKENECGVLSNKYNILDKLKYPATISVIILGLYYYFIKK
jgi:hypothetical protein